MVNPSHLPMRIVECKQRVLWDNEIQKQRVKEKPDDWRRAWIHIWKCAIRTLDINSFPPGESRRPVYTLTHTHTHISYLGVDNRAGNLFHIGQVGRLGHQDRFSGQANLDDEGYPCRCGRQWGYHSPARSLPRCQVHHRKTCGHRGHGYGGPLLYHSWAGRWGAPRRKEDLGQSPWGHTRAGVSHLESCFLVAPKLSTYTLANTRPGAV